VKERLSELSPTGKMMLAVILLLVLCTLTKLGLLPRRRPAFHPNFWMPEMSYVIPGSITALQNVRQLLDARSVGNSLIAKSIDGEMNLRTRIDGK
jgi:hypothetical protein